MYNRTNANAFSNAQTAQSPNKLPPKYPPTNSNNAWPVNQSTFAPTNPRASPFQHRKSSNSSTRDSPSSSPRGWTDEKDDDDPDHSTTDHINTTTFPPQQPTFRASSASRGYSNNQTTSSSNQRDPNQDLDFGIDLRKFGVNELNEELNAVQLGENQSQNAAVHMLSLLYDPPVEGCELKPYVSIIEPALNANSAPRITAVTTDDNAAVEYHWYKGSQRLCALDHCRQSAVMQCLTCVKASVEDRLSWFCSDKCFREAWPQHRETHQTAANNLRRNSVRKDDSIWPQWKYDFTKTSEHESDAQSVACKFPGPPRNTWTEVSQSRSYTPRSDDVGCCLRIEVFPVVKQADQAITLGKPKLVETGATLPVPPLPPPRPVHYSEFHNPASSHSPNTFKVVDYNILAQCYATKQMYPYTPIWALQWEYRKHRILAELVSYNADIICLQEVQSSAFEEFFHPSLSAVGYEGLYKRKTRENPGEDVNGIDGCAIFYRADRFTMVEQYGIEYNEAARQQTMDRKSLRRLMKGNIALVAVLEELQAPVHQVSAGIVRRGRKRRLCVANTHMYWDPEFADVKLWQSYVLTQELEKLILHRQLPLVLCGDFNSLVDSSVYEFLMTQQVHHGDDVFGDNGVGDQCQILPPRTANHSHHGGPQGTLSHHLALTSAYAAIGEPKYTNFTGHFVGVLDYVFYSRRHLRWVSAMEVEQSERKVRQYTALPSPLFSSDHLPLVVELEWIDQ